MVGRVGEGATSEAGRVGGEVPGCAVAVPRLLCLDVDGTLLAPDKSLTVGVRAAVGRAAATEGLTVAISSGRHPFNVAEQLDDLGLPHTAVCLSGSYVELCGREVARHPLGREAVLAALAVAEELGCYISMSGSDFNLTTGHIDRGRASASMAVSRYVELGGYGALRDELVAGRAADVLKSAVHAPDAETYGRMRERLGALSGVEVARSDVNWADVTPAGCTKASGIAELAAALGLGMDEVAAVGDDENDVCALGAVGLGIAMGNAVDAAKAAARVTVADNGHDGCAEAIGLVLARLGE